MAAACRSCEERGGGQSRGYKRASDARQCVPTGDLAEKAKTPPIRFCETNPPILSRETAFINQRYNGLHDKIVLENGGFVFGNEPTGRGFLRVNGESWVLLGWKLVDEMDRRGHCGRTWTYTDGTRTNTDLARTRRSASLHTTGRGGRTHPVSTKRSQL